jgi:hypothetical protein
MKIGINTVLSLFDTRVERYLAPHARLGTPKKKHKPRKVWANNVNRKFGIHVQP